MLLQDLSRRPPCRGPMLISVLFIGLTACAGPRKESERLPSHLLHSGCAQLKDVPGDPTAEPQLFAGCDQAALAAFIRRNIDSTVSIKVARYVAEEKRLKYFAGTGAVIDADGTIITAYHVVKNAEWVVVSARRLSADGQSVARLWDIPVKVTAISAANDAALLRPKYPVPLPPPLPICAAGRPAKGELLWHFGLTTSWAAGEVVERTVIANGTDSLSVDVRVNLGDSGGPFVNERGQVVAVTLAMNEKKTAYAVPIGQALKALGYSGPAKDVCKK